MTVVDASVVMKLLTREADAVLAVSRISRERERTAPDWLQAKVASALAKKRCDLRRYHWTRRERHLQLCR